MNPCTILHIDECEHPEAVYHKYTALQDENGIPKIEFDNASIRFVEATDGRGEGLGGIDISCVDRDAVLDGARQRNCGVNDELVLLGGLRVYLRD